MRKLPSLKQLQHLIALYDHQHFGHAADACYISQSTLSASISNLENILNISLIERDHKTFLFTPMGEEAVLRSRVIIEEATNLTIYAKTQGDPMRGDLRLGIIPTIAPFILTEIQAVCHQHYPDLTLLIREDTTDHVLRLLGEGKLDVVLLALPFETDNFFTQVLCKDPFQLVVPSAWAEKGFEYAINTLPDQSVFLLEKEHCMTGHALHACHLRDNKKINAFFATSLQTLVLMVDHKPGITFLPNLAIHSGLLSDTELVALPIQQENAYREIGIVWRNSSCHQPYYQKLAELIQGVLTVKCG